MNKYKLTGDNGVMGKILYRIIACKTFEDGNAWFFPTTLNLRK